MYRPVGKPHYGGHIERLNRTLMQRLKGLPGATGNSTRGRKERKPEERACMTLQEFERWLALEIGQRYHHSEHRGLFGGTPLAAWVSLAATRARKTCRASTSAPMGATTSRQRMPTCGGRASAYGSSARPSGRYGAGTSQH
jgi:putative transposase